MGSDELFSNDSGVADLPGGMDRPRRPKGRPLGLRRTGRLLLGLVLFIGTFAGATVEALFTSAPAFAAATYTCTTPATGGTAVTLYTGVNNSQSIVCYGVSGVTGTTAYPASITVNSGTLPSSAVDATSTTSSPACTQSTSGSGTTEHYILTCPLTDNPATSELGTYPVTFIANPGTNGGAATVSGTDTITVSNTTQACIAPAAGGTATTMTPGYTNTYTVQCENQTHVSGQAQYPSSITIASGGLPADANQTFNTTTPGCTQSTTGSGTTQQYILSCALTATPTAADAGSYPMTFTSTVNGVPFTSGTLTVTVAPETLACTAPASTGTATTFFSSSGGSANSFSVACYGTGSLAATYPTSISSTGTLPSDIVESTSTSSTPPCVKSTSGSGLTEHYILTCPVTENAVTADNGVYTANFVASDSNDSATVTSGTWTLTVAGPTTTCTAPAAGGTTTNWSDGTASSFSVVCYSQGFASASPGNYPASITLNTGTLPSHATEATSTSSSPACTQSTSGTGTAEQYILTCPVADTPTTSENGTYHATFLATGGANGAANATSGTWTLNVNQPVPSWATSGTTDGNYFSAIKGVPFCDGIEVSAGQVGPTGTNPGSPLSLPLTSLTVGATPSGVTNYRLQNVNLAAGSAQLCGTNNNNAATAPVTMAPVATNSGGSSTDSIPLWSQNECTWTSTGATVSMFDANQDLSQAGSQSAFGQPISNGVTGGSTKDTPSCPGGVGVSASGGLGDAWTMNTANPLPTPTDTNPSAALGDLPSSNLDLTTASGGAVGGCFGAVNILASTSTSAFGTNTASMTLPSSWVNGGNCAYGSLGSNSAGGNTDTPALHGPTGDAACPPNQADVNAGYENCGVILSSGNDENGSTNYTTLDLLYNGQPVPQTPTATLSGAGAQPGDSVSITGGTNWWGDPNGAPDNNPTSEFQNSASDFYPVSAPQVLIGTTRATAIPVNSSTVTIPANTYVCTGAESTTVGPNPCTLTVGQPTGSFKVPSSLTPGAYNLYIDESNTSPLPGNGPNDSYQTTAGRNLGTVESSTPLFVGNPVFTSDTSVSFGEGSPNTFSVTAVGAGSISYSETGALPSGVTLGTDGTLSGTPKFGSTGSYPITITATDSSNNSSTQDFTLTVSASVPVFTSTTSTSFAEHTAGTFSVTATGNTPITFTETGSLPSGVTLGSDGTLSGTPAFGTAGSYPITITATDAATNTSTQDFTLTVTAVGPSFTSAPSTSFAEGTSGTFSVTADGDTPITFTETGALPSGVTLGTDGTLSGKPASATAGSYPITITATDSNSNTSTQDFTLTVTASAPVFTSAPSISFAEGASGTFSVTADGDTPITFTETGSLPSGVTLGSDGTLSGTPATGTAGNYPITITATDSNNSTSTQDFTLTVSASVPVFSSAASTGFAENTAGTFSVTADGDTPITFTESGPLPSGVTLGTDGTLSGKAAFGTAGSYPITITATDKNSNTSTQAFTLTVTASAPVFTSASSISFAEGASDTFSVTADGDTPITFTKTGSLPSGVTLGSNGTLSGKPPAATAGSYPITITATDSNHSTSTQDFTLTVSASVPVFTSAASTSFAENTTGTFSVTATGDIPITFTESGSLPSGVTLASDGTLSGKAAFGTTGSYPITVTATDKNSNTSTQDFTLTVTAGGPSFTSAASTSFTENTTGTFSVTATGHTPITFTETGSLPSGVTLGSGGTLSGKPAFGTAGSYPITITATDSGNSTATQAFALTVTAAGPSFTSAASASFAENTAGTFSVTATGDTPITFTESGALPSGVTLGTGGTLSGTPAAGTAGSYPITITARDSNSNTSTQAFTLTVGTGPSTTVVRPSAGSALAGSVTLDASASAPGGVNKVQYVITGGTYNKSVIGTATPTYYGYVYIWNTKSVPDGSYAIQSLVTGTSSGTAYSAPVSVKVDNTAPTTAVVRPAANSALQGTGAVLDASASDNVSVNSVQYVISGGTYNKSVIGTATPTNYGYVYIWNTNSVPDGSYTLQSLATDEAGNPTYSAAISISVDNSPPTTAVTAPVNGKTLTGTATLKATASDDVSVKTVQFAITGGSYSQHVIGTATLAKGVYKLSWSTTTVPNGTYTLQSVATDEAGNVTNSAPITIKVSN